RGRPARAQPSGRGDPRRAAARRAGARRAVRGHLLRARLARHGAGAAGAGDPVRGGAAAARESRAVSAQTAGFLALSSVRMATPLLLAALGGLYSERSGVVNIALEGLMLAGALTAAVGTHFAHQPWLGLLAAAVAGTAAALVHATAAIRFGANQVVSGMAVNVVFLGLPPLLSGALFASTSETPPIPRGELVTRAPVALAALLVPVTWYVLERPRLGLGTGLAGA